MYARIVLVGLVSVFLTGCGSLPRGAGLESEVLAVKKSDGTAHPEFSVEPVTRASIESYSRWPVVGEPPLPWITRVNRGNGRVIAPGDTVNITIWSAEENGLLTSPEQRSVDLTGIRVSSDGTVFLPYIGSHRISGMNPEHAREVIEQRYHSVTPSAQVQLNLAEGRQNTVSLVSGVSKPGSYSLPDQNFTILGLIAEGGGVQGALNNPQVRLHRGNRIYGTSVDHLLSDPALDTTLVGGDKVYLEADKRNFLSLGAAGTEAVHPFPKDQVTALQALSIIGGVADSRANAQAILVLRHYPEAAVRADGSGPRHERTIFTLDLTSADGLFSAGQFQILPGDLVYATESPLISIRNVIGLIASTTGLADRIID